VELAGFSLANRFGVWLCRDNGGLLPLFDLAEPGLSRRSAMAADRPEDSFVWWLEAEVSRPPDPAALAGHLEAVFAVAWPERCQRL